MGGFPQVMISSSYGVSKIVPVPTDAITKRILFIRGQRVILDSDLDELYGVSTGRFNEHGQFKIINGGDVPVGLARCAGAHRVYHELGTALLCLGDDRPVMRVGADGVACPSLPRMLAERSDVDLESSDLYSEFSYMA